MEINKWYIQGKYFTNKEAILFEGKRSDFTNQNVDIRLIFTKEIPVEFKFYSKKIIGEIQKINKKTVLIHSEKEKRNFKVSIENLIENNRYPESYYRIEHNESGKGPFQHKFKESIPHLENLIKERISFLKENYYRFPVPSEDRGIKEYWNNCLQEERENIVFGCLSKYEISSWLGEELEKELLSHNFSIVQYQKGFHYKEAIIGDHQVMFIKE